ncbi:MAG: PKD domain-containing protein [Bacteroidota bacterium]
MLQYFSRIINYKNICTVIFINLSIFVFSYKSHAQSLGDPLVHITFGSGTVQYAPPLAADSGYTDYGYVNISPEDNYYTIASSTLGMNKGWVFTTDHTGNPGGYMMIVNASKTPGLFYTRTVSGLCGSTMYQFSAWIKNIIKAGGILPNVTFTIEAIDGTPLGTGNTGDILANDTWLEYPFTFSTPANTQTVVVKMINNAPGGSGNDLAIDDITFRPYSSTTFNIAFNQANTSFCAGSPQMVSLKSITPLDPNYAQKLQQLINGVWVDMSPGSTTTSFSFLSSAIAGTYSYRMVKSDAGNINTSNCVVSSNILNVKVVPLPTAIMLVANNTCQGDATVFNDQSLAPNSTIVSWLWDFGDGQTSNQQNPSHIYANAGDYTIKLTVTNKENCVPAVTSKNIHIIPQVNMAFNYSTPDCVTRAVTFNDLSTSAEGSIISRVWDYGDSTATETKADNTPFQHTFATTGSYQVKLVIKTDRGCSATLIKTVVISPLPVVDFTTPKVCLDDSYAQFNDNTTIADNSGNFTYLWDFGDNNATAANPNTSTLKNPQHKYTEAKLYNVSLTVTSNNGCQTTLSKPFMVNGSNPVADFEVLNSTTLCSDHEVLFLDKSTVGIGNITKVVMDYGDSTPSEVDDNPYSGKIYRHSYPQFSSPMSKNYTVSMVAYSGQICESVVTTKNITLLPIPSLTLNAPDDICLNGGSIQFEVKEGGGVAGSGVYSGTGVNNTGLFDPTIAGVGTFTITYTYTTIAGCINTLTHTIKVKPIPTVNAGPDATILAGGSTVLHGKASGDNITYSWFPTTGLSNSTIADPVVTLNNDVTYTLTVTNEEGCSVTDSITVKVLQVPVIPNAFTPNNDGTNDTWIIKYLDSYDGCTVNVFNRNGQKIYSSLGYGIPWDGTLKGSDLPFGVYYYIIDPKHNRKPLSGYVTIIR